MRIIEELEAWGHRNITGKNRTTFEITKQKSITKKGDCILGVKSSKSTIDLTPSFKDLTQRDNVQITMVLRINNLVEKAVGWGSSKLTFTHHEDLVVRKSGFVCNRTLMIKSNKAAKDFPRKFINLLKNPNQKITIFIIAKDQQRQCG